MDSINPETPASRRRFPKWAIILVAFFLLLVAAGVARHGYLAWKEHKIIRAARIYLDQGRTKELHVALEMARALNPRNVEAARLAARAELRENSPKAMIWLRRSVELSSGSLDDKLALADGASRFGQVQEAARVLKEIEAKARNRADYQDLAGRVAQQNGASFEEAQGRYAEAVRLEPNNATYRLHLAITRLASPDETVRNAAREEIEKSAAEASLNAVSLRALVMDAVKQVRLDRALKLARELDGAEGRLFSDRLMYLEVARMSQAPNFMTLLDETEKQAQDNSDNVLALLAWMNGNHYALLGRDWALRLPSSVTSSVPVRMEIARAFALFGDWKKLRFFLAGEQWGDMDYVRKGYLARCSREVESNDKPSRLAWSEAISATANRSDALFSLARMALEWKWDDEAAEALWQAVKKSNRSNEALSALGQLYFSRRQTAGLYQVYSNLISRNPGDFTIQNNFAIFCLLLNKDKNHALNVARELHEKAPSNPAFASTYAFALYCSGQNAKALEVMQALSPEQLQDPSIAAYYSAFLAAAGKTEEAGKYRELGRTANLLPEEARLLNITESENAPAGGGIVLPEPMSGELFPGASAEPSPAPDAPTDAPEPSATPNL